MCGDGDYREDREPLLAELTGKADFAARILDTLVVGATQVRRREVISGPHMRKGRRGCITGAHVMTSDLSCYVQHSY